jgi:hypothetical protein
MPHLEGLGGRLVACDLIGIGGSEKLNGEGNWEMVGNNS